MSSQAYNQVMEVKEDRKMVRTKNRSHSQGQHSRTHRSFHGQRLGRLFDAGLRADKPLHCAGVQLDLDYVHELLHPHEEAIDLQHAGRSCCGSSSAFYRLLCLDRKSHDARCMALKSLHLLLAVSPLLRNTLQQSGGLLALWLQDDFE